LLIYAGSDHKLYRYDLEAGKGAVIAGGEAGNIQGALLSGALSAIWWRTMTKRR